MTYDKTEKIKCFLVNVDRKGHFRFGNDDKWKSFDDLPPGGMYFADWYTTGGLRRTGPDGRYLIVKTPGGYWHVDGRAKNCTRPHDDIHRCWVRHGEAPNITVSKNGNTCGCGHSIGQGPNFQDYHGFLIDGYLVPC